jgi:inorganic phosphate transporter, PiT family
MLAHIIPSSPAALSVLVFCFVLVLAFEATNGFHDAANAVATVIYTHSLSPFVAIVLSGIMNFAGVLLGGVAVAYTMVELLPPDVLTPPDGNPATGMLAALFLAALAWNLATWWRGIPNSSSHCLIGALLGISIAEALIVGRGAGQGVDWEQVWSVISGLLFSPLVGLAGAYLLFKLVGYLISDPRLFEPTKDNKPPRWWVRALLILTSVGVSFAHGSNDGQKSSGLIMLVVIGIFPAQYTLNLTFGAQPTDIAQAARTAVPLIKRYGDDQKALAVSAARNLSNKLDGLRSLSDVPDRERSAVRDNVYRLDHELKLAVERRDSQKPEKQRAGEIRAKLRSSVEFAPWWVRILSAFCLGAGTMVGYRRIVTTIGERIGKRHLTPAQGASAELVAATVIGIGGYAGLPVSTTHILSSGVAGTMAASRAGMQWGTVRTIVAAWAVTLPVTILLSGVLFWLLVGSS